MFVLKRVVVLTWVGFVSILYYTQARPAAEALEPTA